MTSRRGWAARSGVGFSRGWVVGAVGGHGEVQEERVEEELVGVSI